MPFPSGVLLAAREQLQQPNFDDYGFVPYQEGVSVGYVVGPGPHEVSIATGTPIDMLAGESFRVQLTPDRSNIDLFWVKVAQGFGSVLYTWTSKGKDYSFLGVTSDLRDDAHEMSLAKASMDRRLAALRLHQESGLPYAVLRRLIRAVTTYQNGVQAISLAAWLLKEAENNLATAQDRIDRLAIMKNRARLRSLEGFGPAVTMRTGDTLAHVCQGARVVLNRLT